MLHTNRHIKTPCAEIHRLTTEIYKLYEMQAQHRQSLMYHSPYGRPVLTVTLTHCFLTYHEPAVNLARAAD